MGSWLADAVRYCFGFLGSRVSQGGLELTYGVAWGCFRAYFLDVFWKSISMLFRGCDWEWICEWFWLLFWRPWPRFLASQWNFFGRRFGIFFFQNWGKSGSENGQDFCPESGHDFCPKSGHGTRIACKNTCKSHIGDLSAVTFFWTKILSIFCASFWPESVSRNHFSKVERPRGRESIGSSWGSV